jgi:hypothetical protein
MPKKDFTTLAVGEKVVRGEIRVCPKCGKNGIAMEYPSMTFYTHTETVNFSADSVEISDETCQIRKENPKSAESK